MNKLSTMLVGVAIIPLAMLFSQVALQENSYASSPSSDCNETFLTMPAWFNGLAGKVSGSGCMVLSPTEIYPGDDNALSKYVSRIVLNAIAIGTQLAMYLAFLFILYGGFQFLTSGGSPDAAARARKTVLNAMVGVVIALGASAIIGKISEITAPSATASAGSLVSAILTIFYSLSATVAVVAIVVSGYKFVTGGSDPKSIQTARNTILYAVIGLVVIALAAAITNFVIGSIK